MNRSPGAGVEWSHLPEVAEGNPYHDSPLQSSTPHDVPGIEPDALLLVAWVTSLRLWEAGVTGSTARGGEAGAPGN